MTGWHISVFRQQDGGSSPAKAGSEEGSRLAVWQTDVDGLHWLDDLVKAGVAIDLGGDGYPYYYTAKAEHLLPRILTGPPQAQSTWVCGPDDILDFSKWEGKTTIDRALADDCRPDEWLLIVAWDES